MEDKKRYKDNKNLITSEWNTSIGWVIARFHGNQLVSLDIHDTAQSDLIRLEKKDTPSAVPAAVKIQKWLDEYLKGTNPSLNEIEIELHGTPFQELVWEELRTIPYGQSVTYGELAQRIAKKMRIPRMSAQAIGGAVGRNPVSILVPCHRVLGTKAKLTGYGGGLPRKARLLDIEKIPYRW